MGVVKSEAIEFGTTTIPVSALGTGTPTGSKFLRDDGTWQAPPGGGSVTIGSASIAFVDGDTARRTTIADASVTATSKILLSITRPTVTDVNDVGLIYHANVVSRGAGTFDVYTICVDLSGMDPIESPPNETITLHYTVA